MLRVQIHFFKFQLDATAGSVHRAGYEAPAKTSTLQGEPDAECWREKQPLFHYLFTLFVFKAVRLWIVALLKRFMLMCVTYRT